MPEPPGAQPPGALPAPPGAADPRSSLCPPHALVLPLYPPSRGIYKLSRLGSPVLQQPAGTGAGPTGVRGEHTRAGGGQGLGTPGGRFSRHPSTTLFCGCHPQKIHAKNKNKANAKAI